MTTFEIPGFTDRTEAAAICVGRAETPRPDPASLLSRLGLGAGRPIPLAILRQIHSNRCLRVRRDPGKTGDAARVVGEADALITTEPGLALGIATADCVPLVALDPVVPALAVVHAGWRGTLARILPAAIEAMRDLGARPDRIRIGAGPAAGGCCYEVGPDVLEAFARETPSRADGIITPTAGGRGRLDLVEANRLQAIDAGVDPASFGSTGVCTICRPDVCHSYRRDGAAAGRMWLLAALRDTAA